MQMEFFLLHIYMQFIFCQFINETKKKFVFCIETNYNQLSHKLLQLYSSRLNMENTQKKRTNLR